ncbi:MAG: hypothetical protein H0T72_02205 [Chloroflexia bacterium]|nr:hypothetical protein [Chloroflexia bacterium]
MLPNADLLAARNLFTSNAEWRRRWPGILPTLAALVFFDDADGCIGAGVEREIVGAHGLGIPVYFLPGPPVDALVPCDDTGRVEFWPVYGQGWRQTLRVCHAVPASDARALLSKGGA